MQFEHLLDDLPSRTMATHAAAEAGVAQGTAARLTEQAHHLVGALGESLAQPFLEHRQHLCRHAQQGEEGLIRAGRPYAAMP